MIKPNKYVLSSPLFIITAITIVIAAGGYFILTARAAALSTFTTTETVANVTAGVDNQTFSLSNYDTAEPPGVDDQIAATSTIVANITAGADDQDFTPENIIPNSTDGVNSQTFTISTTTTNQSPGVDNQTALAATSVENVIAGINDQTMIATTTIAPVAAGVNDQVFNTATPVPNVEEIKASRTLTVNARPHNDEYIIIGGNCTITFVASSSVTDDETDCSDNAATIDRDIGELNTPRTAGEIAAVLRQLTNVSCATHGALVVSGAASTVIFTTAGEETDSGGIPYDDWTGGDISSSSSTPGTVAEAQVSTFTPDNIEVGDGFYATINSNTYAATATAASAQNVVELLQPLMDADPDVSCTEDDVKISCTAAASGAPFSLSAFAVNRPAVAQVDTITPENVESGDTFTVTIEMAGSESVTATSSCVKTVVERLNDQLNNDFIISLLIDCTEDDEKITCVNKSPGSSLNITASTVNRPAVAQVMTYTPANVESGDGFYATINSNTYAATATVASAQNAVELLQPLMDADPDVSCTEDDIKVTCTAVASGTPFAMSAYTANYGGRAQVCELTPATIEIGDIFTISGISDSIIYYTATSTTASVVTRNMAAAVNATSTLVSADYSSNKLILTAQTPGTGFFAVPGTINRAAAAQVDEFTPVNAEEGDTFTIFGLTDPPVYFTATTTNAAHVVNALADWINASSTEITASNYNDKLRLTANIAGTPFTATSSAANREAVAQVVSFTAHNIELWDRYYVQINDNTYETWIYWDLKHAIEHLQEQADADPAVYCSEDDITLTCAAIATGTAFLFDAWAVNRPGQQQVDGVTPANIEPGDIFGLSGISDSAILFTATTTSADHVIDALAEAINATSTVAGATNAGPLWLVSADAYTSYTVTPIAINRAGVAQTVAFTPANVTAGETFTATINGTSYGYKATAASAKNVVEGLQPLMNANAYVSCTEDDAEITCVADTAGLAFTYSASVAGVVVSSGGGGGGIIYQQTIYCSSVTYGEWSDCANSAQSRNIISRAPAGCTLTAAQEADRHRDCAPAFSDASPSADTAAPGANEPLPADPLVRYKNESDRIAAGSYGEIVSEIGLTQNRAAEDAAWKKYSAPLVAGHNLSYDQNGTINRFIAYGTAATLKLGAGERAGVVNSYKKAYDRLPVSASDWEDVIKIANGRWPGKKNYAKESEAVKIFKEIYRRDNLPDGYKDNAAIVIITYGLRIGQRDIDKEKAALATFRDVYRRLPATTTDWDILRAIAYSGARRNL